MDMLGWVRALIARHLLGDGGKVTVLPTGCYGHSRCLPSSAYVNERSWPASLRPATPQPSFPGPAR